MSDADVEGRYAFKMEWFDTQASIVRSYLLWYHRVDDTIEMFDMKNKRTFLKRVAYPSVKLSDLYIGAQINIYARQLKVLDHGDDWTKNKLSVSQARTLVVVKANAYKSIGAVVDHLYGKGLQVSKLRMMRMSSNEAVSVFGPQSDIQGFTVGPIVAMEVVGSDVQQSLAAFNESEEMIYISTAETGDYQCKQLLENAKVPTTAQFDNCTMCVIRPHSVLSGHAGPIIDSILRAGFEISAMQLFNLDRQAADEFLEVYKGVIAEYNAIAEEFTTGSSIALEIRGQDVVNRFRDFAGPTDPEVARLIRPNCLRSEFGEDKIKNAVHCTDLPEDGVLESEYFFSILRKSDAIAFNRGPVVSSYTGFRGS